LVCLTDLHCNPPVKFVEFCDVCSSRIFCSFLLIFFLFFSDDASYASAAKRPPKQQLLLNEIDLTHFIEGDNGQKIKKEEQEKNLHKGVLLLPTRERGRKKNGSIQFSRGSRDPNPNPRRSSSSPSFTFFLHSLFFAGRSPTTISLSFPLASKAPQVNGVVAVLVLYFLLSPHFFSFFPILHNIFLSYCAL